MSLNTVDKEVCIACGMDIRENTLFCYNCGRKIYNTGPSNGAGIETLRPVKKPTGELETPSRSPLDENAKAALEGLSERIRQGSVSTGDEAIALAAEKRKKARSSKRRSQEFTWEPVDGPPDRLLLVIVAAIALLATAAVVITAIWK